MDYESELFISNRHFGHKNRVRGIWKVLNGVAKDKNDDDLLNKVKREA